MRGPMLYLPFRITGQGVLANGEVKYEGTEPQGNRQYAADLFCEVRGVLAWSH